MHDYGVVGLSDDEIDELSSTQLRAKKIQFLQKLYPEARAYVFSQDPQESLDLQNITLSLVEKPRNEKAKFSDWLRASFGNDLAEALEQSQIDF